MRTAPPEWTRELHAIGGAPSERQTHLAFYWWAGEPWAKIERWSIWELAPRGYLERQPRYAAQLATVLEALEGPPPKSLRVFDGAGVFLRSDARVTQEQWELYRRTGCLARPFWILQGTHGGHKVRFTQQESQLLALHGLPRDPPAPGDLPYCEWDARSRVALGRQRALYEEGLTFVPGRFTERSHLVLRKQQEVRFREALLAWLRPQVQAGSEEFGAALKDRDLPIAPEVTDEQLEGAREAFIHDTSTTLEA